MCVCLGGWGVGRGVCVGVCMWGGGRVSHFFANFLISC